MVFLDNNIQKVSLDLDEFKTRIVRNITEFFNLEILDRTDRQSKIRRLELKRQ